MSIRWLSANIYVVAAVLWLSGVTGAVAGFRYVAPNGLDSNPGTIGEPYRTVQKCATTVPSGWTCRIRAGDYPETVTPGSGVTIAAYGGESVTIDGSDAIPATAWQLFKGEIYRARVTLGVDGTNQLFLGGEMLTEARWPAGDDLFHPVWATLSGATQTGTDAGGNEIWTLTDSALPNRDWVGTRIHLWSGTDPWNAQTGVVTAAQKGQLTVTLDDATYPPYIVPQAGGHFYLFDSRVALTAPGQWYYDAATRWLYFDAPAGVNPSTLALRAKQRQYGFDLSGTSHVTIRGVHLFATAIDSNAGSSDNVIDGITATYVSHFTILVDTQADGSYWYKGAMDSGIVINGTGNTLENSTIAYSAGDGVALLGTNNVVHNNLIHHVDYAQGQIAGIIVYGANLTVTDNTVYATGRYATEILTWSGTPVKNIDIGYNNMYAAMMLGPDGGEIYSGSPPCVSGSTIHHNWVHDAQYPNPGDAFNITLVGIYLDEDACGWQVDQNVAWNNEYFNIIVHGSSSGATDPNDNWIHNNSVIDVNPNGYIRLQSVNYCGTTRVANNFVLVPLQQIDSACTVAKNNASAPGANEMTSSVKVGCDFAGCASEGPPKICGQTVAASIALQPYDVTVPAGKTATFTVTAGGSPTLKYQWKKNGAKIAGAISPTYTTPSTSPSDNGTTYSAIAVNACGRAESAAATLTVD